MNMSRRSHHSLIKSLLAALGAGSTKESYKLADEADALEATHGEEAVDLVRDRIVSANRKARKELYRLHDELARRRRDHPDGDALAV
jgi:hypothetical protein